MSESVTEVIFTVTAQLGRQLYERHLQGWQVDAAGVAEVGSYRDQLIDRSVLGIQCLHFCNLFGQVLILNLQTLADRKKTINDAYIN